MLGTLQPSDISRIDNVAATIWGPELGTDSLKRFLNRTWFERRWILQEASKARSTIVRCGDEKIAWKLLVDACVILSPPSNSKIQTRFNTQAWRALDTIQTIESRGVPLLALMWKVDHAQCSDFRDKLFALYGLLDSPSKETLPVVDYEVRWDENYTSFAVSCISNGHFDTILRHITAFGSLHDSDTTFPSWVPDWRLSRVRNLPAWPSQPGNHPYNEHFPTSMLHTRLVGGALEFQECHLTRDIAHVFVPSDSESWSWDELKHWAWPRKEFGADEKTLWSPVQKAAFEALCLGISLLLDAKEVSDDQSRHLRLALQFFDGNQTLSRESTALHIPSLMPLMRQLLSHHTLISCSAQNGDTLDFGIGPSTTCVGDRILYRSSFSWAYRGKIGCVIRPCQDQSFSTRHYQVVDAKLIGAAVCSRFVPKESSGIRLT